jgi:dynein heavy chain
MLSELPNKVITTFERGKHLSFKEAQEKLKEKLGDSYYENSAMITILKQEIDRFNALLAVIFRTTNDLIKALKGEIIISKSSENTYASILVQKVPEAWESHSYPSLKPLALWLKDLLKRLQFFSLWAKTLIQYVEGTSSIMNPYSLWISSFFFPQGLLASISQNYARKLHVSIDSLAFQYDVENSLYEENESIDGLFESENARFKSILSSHEGILIYGMFMDGGRWDRNESRIVDSPQRFLPMPHFICKLVKVKNKRIF